MLSTKMFNALRSMQKLNPVSAHQYSTKQYQVFHDHKLKEFTLGQEKGEKAVLQYKELEPSVILLEHTIVPAKFQGQGIGKLLAEAALEFALDKNLKVKISCDFVKKYLEKNPKPEFKKIVLDN